MSEASDGKELVGAAARGDADKVRRLLAAGADVNARNARGSTALQIAAHVGKEDVVRVLLPHDPDLSARASDGWRALTAAAANTFETPTGRTDEAEELLETGRRDQLQHVGGLVAPGSWRSDPEVLERIQAAEPFEMPIPTVDAARATAARLEAALAAL